MVITTISWKPLTKLHENSYLKKKNLQDFCWSVQVLDNQLPWYYFCSSPKGFVFPSKTDMEFQHGRSLAGSGVSSCSVDLHKVSLFFG